jgi:hypothetical protein
MPIVPFVYTVDPNTSQEGSEELHTTSMWPEPTVAALSPTPSAPAATIQPSPTPSPTKTQTPPTPPSRKAHRGRSRSLPNLIFSDSKVHKRTADPSSPARRKRRSGAPFAVSGAASYAVSDSSSNSNRPVTPPPVNGASLREIDLTEIFKNPQLRHDIVFDPQLQFRPNLDGERGKRKKMLAEKYWQAIGEDCEALVSGSATAPPRLILMFSTLREILLSLLPAKNRSQVDAVLDPELLMQQIRHSALDFVGLAKWLAEVFKAHCAPMRDAWVDQMVDRIELGISTRAPHRLVEGLRMVFAILEAMKLDVANHQIRTLRPMLVDSAVEFEQEYYNQVTSKGKIDFSDALNWYKDSLDSFRAADHPATGDIHRCAFIYGLLRLLSCSASSGEFPSTFGFDMYRLAGFRAEVRKVVCVHLCVSLYQQVMAAELASAGVVSRSALSSEAIAEFKQDLVAIISDSAGNTKWTKNTHSLSLEMARRVEETVYGRKVVVPSTRLVDLCSGWLCRHLQPKSELYKLLETRTITNLFNALCTGVTVLSGLDANVVSFGAVANPITADSPVFKEITALTDRILVLVKFHWGVFGKYYTAHVNESPSSTTLVLGHTSTSMDMNLSPAVERTARIQRMRQPSTC